jgi:hypothetical protein
MAIISFFEWQIGMVLAKPAGKLVPTENSVLIYIDEVVPTTGSPKSLCRANDRLNPERVSELRFYFQ